MRPSLNLIQQTHLIPAVKSQEIRKKKKRRKERREGEGRRTEGRREGRLPAASIVVIKFMC